MKPENEVAHKINLGTPLVNVRWENFAIAMAGGATKSDAYRTAGYSITANAGTMASRLFENVIIQERVEFIRDRFADEKIMSMRERKIRLSEIARGTLRDFHDNTGLLTPFADGVGNQAALAQVEHEFDETGMGTYPVKIKLHNPIPAIDLLNKLDGAYPPSKMEVTGQNGGPIRTEDTRVKLLGLLGRISVRLSTKNNTTE